MLLIHACIKHQYNYNERIKNNIVKIQTSYVIYVLCYFLDNSNNTPYSVYTI